MVVSEESERKGTLGATNHKNIKVNCLEVDGEQVEPGGQIQPKKPGGKKEAKSDRPDKLMVTLEAAQSDIAVLKEAVYQREREKEPTLDDHLRTKRKRVCPAWQTANQEFCDYCFHCGSSDHFARGCCRGAASRPNQGNRRRLPPRDREKLMTTLRGPMFVLTVAGKVYL